MVVGILNGKAYSEGSCAEEIVDAGEREGEISQAYYQRGREQDYHPINTWGS